MQFATVVLLDERYREGKTTCGRRPLHL